MANGMGVGDDGANSLHVPSHLPIHLPMATDVKHLICFVVLLAAFVAASFWEISLLRGCNFITATEFIACQREAPARSPGPSGSG
jgi:hypothetical protein